MSLDGFNKTHCDKCNEKVERGEGIYADRGFYHKDPCYKQIKQKYIDVFLFYLFVTGIFVVKSSISINSLAAFNLFIAFVTMCFIKSIQTHLYFPLFIGIKRILDPSHIGPSDTRLVAGNAFRSTAQLNVCANHDQDLPWQNLQLLTSSIIHSLSSRRKLLLRL